MKWKSLGYKALLVATAAAGVFIGRYVTLDRNYRVEREEGLVMLKYEDTGKRYALSTYQGEVYLGDSNHHLAGLQAMSTEEGMKTMRPTINRLQQEVDSLETKIAARRVTDAVEDVGGNILEGWRNFKHNLIEK